MPLASDQPSTSIKGKGSGGKTFSHGRHPSSGKPVDGDPSQPKFPRIEDCAHFHYEAVDYGRIKVAFIEESSDGLRLNGTLNIEGFNPAFNVRISCKENTWVVRRNLPHFGTLDEWLHECVFDRKFSHLPVLNIEELRTKTIDEIQEKLRNYLKKLSSIIDKVNGEAQIFCAPVLHWLEIDSRGRNLAPHALGDVADINIPAIAAARVVRRYQARDDDELNLDVGDMVSIIEMGVSGWWRGKQGLKVGSFPSQCVKRINSATDAVGTHERTFSTSSHTNQNQEKPIARKHGKFMEFLRSFLDTRPTKAHLKRKGILRERVFGCDLGELLHRTDEDIPAVVADCTRFVEKYGVVDGIYRISGGSTNIRHLKYEFDSDQRPDLENHLIDVPNVSDVPGMAKEKSLRCDPHSVAGLCKLYFRELPNPLLTYQLYNRFASAVTDYEAEDRLLNVHDVIQQLPPPHYRTLKHLITHLRFMADQEERTSMHSRNLAIVWAPNLLRSREIEAGLAAFTEARVQSVVTEFLIVNGDLLFSEKLQTIQYDSEHKPPRPRSLMIVPTPKLISLEEAQARSKSGVVTPVSQTNSPLDVAISGVRLRHAPDKSTANEKRKRSKKATSPACHSPHPVRTSKKQGHRYTASCSDPFTIIPQPNSPITPTRVAASWKVKLGGLLRKNTLQSQMIAKQGSLRRTRSYDSLRLNHESLPKVSDNTSEFSDLKTSLSRAKSCEVQDTGSDRSHPEPQVPYSHHLLPPIHAAMRIEPLKPPDDVETESKVVVRCSSPCCSLDTDLPSVMDENGLDFDPLSYRLDKAPSPTSKDTASQTSQLETENIFNFSETDIAKHNFSEHINRHMKLGLSLSENFQQVTKHSSKPSSVFRPIHLVPRSDEHFFQQNPTNGSEFSIYGRRHTYSSPISIQKPSITINSQVETNISSNNNTPSRNVRSRPLDDLTADSFTQSSITSSRKPSKISAAERLGLSKVKAVLPIGISKKSPPRYETVDKKWKIQQRVDVPTPMTELSSRESYGGSQSHQSELTNRKISVQVYNMPSKGHLKKDDHYGSFIALVGSAVNKNPTSSNAAQHQAAIGSVSASHGSKGMRYADAEPAVGFVPVKPKPFWYEPRVVHTRVGHSKLETFSPAGKCRYNYPDMAVDPPNYDIATQSTHTPPPNSLNYAPSNYDLRYQDHLKHGAKSTFPSSQPLRHGRSCSVGDSFSPTPVQSSAYQSRPLQTPDVVYENRTYEDFYHFYNSRKGPVETLSSCANAPFSLPATCSSRLSKNMHPHPSLVHNHHRSPAMDVYPSSLPVTGQFYRRNSAGTAFSNPSYELHPPHHKSKGRYEFPQNRPRPTLIASVQENSSSLSWV